MSTPDPDITSRLTASVARIAEATTATEIDLLRRYQALDRTYEIVAGVERGRIQLEDLDAEHADLVAAIIETLDDVSTRWRTPEPLVLFRGQRIPSESSATSRPSDGPSRQRPICRKR